MKRLSRVLVTGVLLVLGVQTSHAQAPQWLQSFVAPSDATSLQSFTWSGLTTNDPYTFGLYEFDGTNLTSSALWTQAMANSVTDTDVQTFFPNTAVTPGMQYALGLHVGGASQALPGDVFPGGEFYIPDGSGGYLGDFSGSDAKGFAINFGVTATPEPASLALLATGLVGVAFVRRKRTTAR